MKLMLIDGNSLTYRAFFALPSDMATASGQVTNAVFGFTSMLINLLREHRPDRIAVAFDLPEPTFRHEALASYKAQRDETPELLRPQFGLVNEVLDAFEIKQVSLAGFEADDVIATLATRARDGGDEVIVVTGDRDAYQLVEDPLVRVLYNKRGVSDYAFYDEAGIEARTGVTPASYVEYAALRGDPSDNLPGVNGVGEKTAAKLINAYGTVENVIAHAEDQTPKLRANLIDGADRARVNVELMRLVRDAPVPVELEDLAFSGRLDASRVRRCFDFLEFRGLFDRLGDVVELVGSDDAGSPVLEVLLDPSVEMPDDDAELVSVLQAMSANREEVVLAASGIDDTPRSGFLALSDPAKPAAVLVFPLERLHNDAVVSALQEFLVGRPIVGHGIKPIVRRLLNWSIRLDNLSFDTMLASYLLDPAGSSYSVDELADRAAPSVSDGASQGRLDLGGGDDNERAVSDLARRVITIGAAVGPLRERLATRGMEALLREIELPLVGVLARMEHVGVGVDVSVLRSLLADLRCRVDDLAAQIQLDAGTSFNVNSTKQLREVLFERLGLAPQKKTKTGFSTDAATLERLRDDHPIVGHLLEYRELEKLRSTYGEGLLAEVASDGRIHATFNQTVARTGRLSSDRPNLHSIPVRSEEGRAFRRAFVPRPGTELLVADYNQIELRCIAHLSEDPGLIGAFARGEDVHTATAARVFGVEPQAVTHEQRSKAKMVSYGLAYGMEAFGLSQRLGIERSEAAEILEAYFAAFPRVRAYMDDTVERARELGYTETLFGRRRPIPELASPNARLRAAGERQAMNAGIQGLAADIFKLALVHLDNALHDGGRRSTLILQVHDEVLFEVPPEEHDEMAELTRSVMMGAATLSVPLEVHLSFGENWADAKQ